LGLIRKTGSLPRIPELGTVKLTLQKYYRINGGSVQLKGVFSDIVLPDNLEYLKVREKDDEDALPWDEITKAHYLNTNSPFDLKALQQMSNQRLENNVSFKLIKENSEWLAKQNDKDYSLNIATYRKERKMISATIRQMENLMKLQGTELDVQALSSETNKY
jgi:carboxyl-terminal processing protease